MLNFYNQEWLICSEVDTINYIVTSVIFAISIVYSAVCYRLSWNKIILAKAVWFNWFNSWLILLSVYFYVNKFVSKFIDSKSTKQTNVNYAEKFTFKLKYLSLVSFRPGLH